MSDEIQLDIRALTKATERLDEALRAYAATPENLFILDSVIKRFELSYLQVIRVMERFIRDYAPVSLESDASFRELIESAIEFSITETSFEQWLDFVKRATRQRIPTWRVPFVHLPCRQPAFSTSPGLCWRM